MILVSRALPPVSGQEPGQDFDFDVDQRSSVTDQSTSLSRVAIHIVIFIIVCSWECITDVFATGYGTKTY